MPEVITVRWEKAVFLSSSSITPVVIRQLKTAVEGELGSIVKRALATLVDETRLPDCYRLSTDDCDVIYHQSSVTGTITIDVLRVYLPDATQQLDRKDFLANLRKCGRWHSLSEINGDPVP